MQTDTTIALGRLIDVDSRPRLAGRLLGWLFELPLIGRWLARAGRAPNKASFVSTRVTRVHARLLHEDIVLAGMNLGLQRDPAWALNLAANPDAAIELRAQQIAVTARQATGEEAAALWRRWLELQPSAEAFHQLAGRDIPLFVLKRRE